MKKVTIITATYNLIKEGREDYFKQMFDSVQNQTYCCIEHLIIDGGSKDGTLLMIRKLRKLTRKLGNLNHEIRIISKPDTGIYNAFNKGINNATGDYIIFMNSDDYYCDKDAIKLLVKAIKGKDFATADTLVIEGKKEHVMKSKASSYFHCMPFCHQTMLCKKELFEEFGLFDETYKLASDYKFIVKVMKAGKKFAEVKKILVNFRETGSSIEQTDTSKKEMVFVLQELLYDYEFKEVEALIDNKLGFLLFLKVLFSHNDIKGFRKPFVKKALKNILRLKFIIKPIENLLKTKKGKS